MNGKKIIDLFDRFVNGRRVYRNTVIICLQRNEIAKIRRGNNTTIRGVSIYARMSMTLIYFLPVRYKYDLYTFRDGPGTCALCVREIKQRNNTLVYSKIEKP